MNLEQYIFLFSNYLTNYQFVKEPKTLYEPMQYILDLGGKRIRPVLTLIAAEGFRGNYKEALPAALSVEVFHNFTLLHDDIMDAAAIRRGKSTVHEKWNVNTGILSGDIMLIKSYHYLENYEAEVFKKLTHILSKTAIEVCEGQQLDMDFEFKIDVELLEYMEMIKLKTAVLLGAALQMGALVAKANEKEQSEIYEFGVQLGLAFQLQDDFLDTFGNSETFGKKIGGDIIENKKTWLFLKTLALADETDRKMLVKLYSEIGNPEEKIEKVKLLFQKYKVEASIQNEIRVHSENAFQILNRLAFNPEPKKALMVLMEQLQHRNH